MTVTDIMTLSAVEIIQVEYILLIQFHCLLQARAYEIDAILVERFSRLQKKLYNNTFSSQ